ncbi:MAG: divalent cation tolerance protein CutA [Helicobacter sp.]|nr:divalent cation tolerance protein CutA [Helicobacter sp.]
MKSFVIIKTTYPDESSAKKAQQLLLDSKLCACASISNVQSTYIWQGELKHCIEYELSIKTLKSHKKLAIKNIKISHPYELPEIICLKAKAQDNYYKWLKISLK